MYKSNPVLLQGNLMKENWGRKGSNTFGPGEPFAPGGPRRPIKPCIESKLINSTNQPTNQHQVCFLSKTTIKQVDLGASYQKIIPLDPSNPMDQTFPSIHSDPGEDTIIILLRINSAQ